MGEKNLQNSFLIGLLLLVTAAFLWLIRGFLQPAFWAAALAIVFHPMYRRIDARLKGRHALASATSVVAIVLIVILPLTAIGVAVAREAIALYERIESGELDLQQPYEQVRTRLPQLLAPLDALGIDLDRLREQVSSAAMAASQFLARNAIAVGQDALRITVLFALMLYLLFFFLRDGVRLLDLIVRALPLGDERERRLFARFAEVSRATIKGNLVVAAVQGAIGGIAFAILGLGAPILWGVVIAFVALLPAVGPPLVWVPAAILLFATGRTVAGLVLVAIGVLVIGLVDNLLRPILVGRDTRMPDYLILLSTLGGLTVFGLSGIVIGPIIAALFLSVWDMFSHEFPGASDSTAAAASRREAAPPAP